jgi:hypothetical protein
MHRHDMPCSRTVEVVGHHWMRELAALVGCDVRASGARERDKNASEHDVRGHGRRLLIPTPQLFCAPAAAHALSGQIPAELMLDPKGGMLPPYHVRHEPECTSFEVVPLM